MTTRVRIVAGAALLIAGYFAYQYATQETAAQKCEKQPDHKWVPVAGHAAGGYCSVVGGGQVDFAGSSPDSPVVQDGPITQPWQV